MKTIAITNGPSREELFDGLRLLSEERSVKFIIENNGREMRPAVLIRSIEAEDDSGQSWNIKLSIDKNFIETHSLYLPRPTQAGSVTVKAYYSSKTRDGKIIIE